MPASRRGHRCPHPDSDSSASTTSGACCTPDPPACRGHRRPSAQLRCARGAPHRAGGLGCTRSRCAHTGAHRAAAPWAPPMAPRPRRRGAPASQCSPWLSRGLPAVQRVWTRALSPAGLGSGCGPSRCGRGPPQGWQAASRAAPCRLLLLPGRRPEPALGYRLILINGRDILGCP